MRPVVIAYSTVAGGAENYLTRLYSQLAALGDEPRLIGQVDGWAETGLPRTAIELGPKWGKKTIVQGHLRAPLERKRVEEAVAKISAPSYFHLQFKREQILFTKLLSQRAPVIWTEHGLLPSGLSGKPLMAEYRAAARYVAGIMCVSQEVAASVRAVVPAGTEVHVIENSIDTSAHRLPSDDERAAARAELDIEDGVPVLLWIGRMSRGKRPDFAIELARAWRGVTLIAGTGEMFDEVRAAAAGVPGARVLGHRSDTETLYRAADVMTFTSTGAGEGYPTTTMVEAASYGVPMVTDALAGAGRVARDIGAPVAAAPTASAWLTAIEQAMTPEVRAGARAWAQKHDVKLWTQAHQEWLGRLVAAR
ncbi:glycosyltransferase family 4 protein [Microbacteriaceae bacterium VKM Ac-2854]|nr:glycosyltransferase family 4 protein [Microbacteriaceae bacterium VKM Ac-2854]